MKHPSSRFRRKISGTRAFPWGFLILKVGTIAGCFVTDGKIVRIRSVRLLRDGKVIIKARYRRLRDSAIVVREVATGLEGTSASELRRQGRVRSQL
jgi:translation initiation factor IF-2